MKRPVPSRVLVLLLVALGFSVCHAEEKSTVESPSPIKGPPLPVLEVIEQDKPTEEINAYRQQARQLYNESRFDELEALAAKARTTKARFGNGSWAISEFYGSFDCRDEEPESAWQLHDRIHRHWIEAQPQSITARVAHAGFLVSYAWRARGSDYADAVKEEGWRLFAKRLAEAQTVLTAARKLEAKCPLWWSFQMAVALGEDWDGARYDALFAEAKAFEPEFWNYDLKRAYYLLPRWHGEPGDWEEAAEKELARPGLGAEAYARVVLQQRRYSETNVFRETKASWPKTREGLEILRQKYPGSLDILTHCAQLAYLAGDRPTAQKLFTEIGGRYYQPAWKDKARFIRLRTWAYDEPPPATAK